MLYKKIKIVLLTLFLIVGLNTLAYSNENNSKKLSTEKSSTTSNESIAAKRGISLSFTGDILTHRSLYLKARNGAGYDFRFAFKDIKSQINSDINFCQLETPLSKKSPTSYPVFHTPVELASALAYSGFDVCSQASNHSLDAGREGVRTTKEYLQKNNIFSTGSNLDNENFALVERKGIKVAYLAYTYGTNGIKPPEGEADIVNMIRVKRILNDARSAKLKADIVVVYLHWGDEYKERVSAFQENLANTLTQSPNIDLIVGSHIHQLQKFEIVNGKPVVYGLGNFWSGQGVWSDMIKGQISAIVNLNFSLEAGQVIFSGGSASATYVDGSSWRVLRAKGSRNTISCFSLSEVRRLFAPRLSTDDTCLK